MAARSCLLIADIHDILIVQRTILSSLCELTYLILTPYFIGETTEAKRGSKLLNPEDDRTRIQTQTVFLETTCVSARSDLSNRKEADRSPFALCEPPEF